MKWLSVVAAVVLVVLTMHPGGGSTLDISLLVSCQPDCTGVENGGKVPDPFNCTNFYYCLNGSPTPHPSLCSDGSHFDLDESDCRAGTGCKPLCLNAGCPLTCTGQVSYIADAADCSVYYECTPGGPVPAVCPSHLPHFDGENCVNDESVCCTGYCEPSCQGDGKFAVIPDPVDCTKYYICDESTPAGPPDADKHFPCSSGQIFNVATLQCVAGDPNSCVTLCDAAGGGGGGGDVAGGNSGGGGGGLSGCVGSLTCPDAGNYAACDTCDPQYFQCKAAGAAGVLKTCPDGYVFNRNSNYPICVTETNCS